MIGNAHYEDLPSITEIRASVRENRLRDPSRVTLDDLRWFIDNPGMFVWDEHGVIAGFSAADPEMEAFLPCLWTKSTRDAE